MKEPEHQHRCGATVKLTAKVVELEAEITRWKLYCAEHQRRLTELLDKMSRDREYDWCSEEGECWLSDGPCAFRNPGHELSLSIELDDKRITESIDEE